MKDPVALSESSVLGIQVYRHGSNLFWRQHEEKSIDCPDVLTKRSLFALCGRLVAHYPVAGFLRISCSYPKRVANAWSEGWDQVLSSAIVDKCQSLQCILEKNDPVGGLWSVSGSDEATLWADASSIGIGALVEIGGHVIEDVAWIRDQSDVRHINVAQLEASIKALSLATKWKLKCFVLKIDSVTVFGWLNKVINNVSRVRVGGLYETVVLRRLKIVRDIIQTFGLKVTLSLVPSEENKADQLTRLPVRTWCEEVRLLEKQLPACSVQYTHRRQKPCPVHAKTIACFDISQLYDIQMTRRFRS